MFGNYGRYYARVPNDLAARALSADASLTADYFDANLTQPVPNGTVTTNATTGDADDDALHAARGRRRTTSIRMRS